MSGEKSTVEKMLWLLGATFGSAQLLDLMLSALILGLHEPTLLCSLNLEGAWFMHWSFFMSNFVSPQPFSGMAVIEIILL